MGFGENTTFGSKSFGAQVDPSQKGQKAKHLPPQDKPDTAFINAIKEKLRKQRETIKTGS